MEKPIRLRRAGARKTDPDRFVDRLDRFERGAIASRPGNNAACKARRAKQRRG
jgi:hypothetical protein